MRNIVEWNFEAYVVRSHELVTTFGGLRVIVKDECVATFLKCLFSFLISVVNHITKHCF